jgi:hypothetical protein
MRFETRHVLQQPAYNSMYFPGQGVLLARGRTLFGHPWAGVSIGTILLGGRLATARIWTVSYWINSYWGGSVPVPGGALVWGAYPRLAGLSRPVDGLPLGCGLSLMAVSRPFEGLAFAAPVTLAIGSLVVTLAWQDPPRPGHRRQELRAYHNWEPAQHERLKSPATPADVPLIGPHSQMSWCCSQYLPGGRGPAARPRPPTAS